MAHGPIHLYKEENAQVIADAEFIAHFRNHARSILEELRASREVIKEIQNYGPTEPSDGACWFCDMGGAGYSTKSKGNHDDNCLWCKARAHLEKFVSDPKTEPDSK